MYVSNPIAYRTPHTALLVDEKENPPPPETSFLMMIFDLDVLRSTGNQQLGWMAMCVSPSHVFLLLLLVLLMLCVAS